MIRRLVAALLVAAAPGLAQAQIAVIAPDVPLGNSSDQIVNTRYLQTTLLQGIPLGAGTIFIGNASNFAQSRVMSGDCSISITGILTCTQSAGNFKVNGALTVTGGATVNGTLTVNGAIVDTSGGLTLGNPIGGSKGSGTANASVGYYVNGVLLPTISSSVPLSMSMGGTGGSLIPSPGAIVYTDAFGMRVLPSPFPGKFLRSGFSAPNWTQTTWSDIYAASSLLYANGPNNIQALPTCNSGVIATSTLGVPSCVVQEPFGFENCSLAASVATSILTVSLKDNAGNDPSATSPCRIAFRNATAATGSWTVDSVTAALSINTNAIGATLASSNSTAFRFWVVAFDNGGTVVLSLYNASTATSCAGISEGAVQSSTAISAAATSAGVFYTPNGTTLSSKAIKILGYVEYNSTGLATAGTYATGPNFIQSFGPGVSRPCNSVQQQYATDTTQTSTSDTTPVITGTVKSITLSSAANLVRVSASGSSRNSDPNTAVCNIKLSRGTGPTFIGSIASNFSNSTGSVTLNNYASASLLAFDKPNSTSSTSYNVYVVGSGAGAANFCTWDPTGAVGQSAILVEEIMG